MPKASQISDNHLPRLLEAAREGRNPRRDVALVLLAAETGIRPVELALLTWAALTDAAGSLTGRATWRTAKRGGWRDVALSAPTLAALAALYGTGRAHRRAAPVFLTNRRAPFEAQSVRAHFKAMFAKAGLDASCYSLRHLAFDSEAQTVVEHGGTGATLLGFTGHKSLSSVQHYLDRHEAAAKACTEARAERMAGL